jgi:hypothetical protein
MAEFLNPIAELDKADSGKIIIPEEAYKVKDEHQFFCPDFDCKDPARILTPAISVNKNFFFRHKPNCKHDIRPETLLHKLAVKWFEGRSEFEVPPCSALRYRFSKQALQLDPAKTECEYRKMKVVIPDVKCCTLNGFVFAIEIFVTSDVSKDKQKLITEFGLPTVRIDLSSFYEENRHQCRVDMKFINENLPGLLTDVNLKSWVIFPSRESIEGKVDLLLLEESASSTKVLQKKDGSGTGCVLGLISLGSIYLFYQGRK